MSAVINKAKSQYQKALKIEFSLFILLAIGISVWQGRIGLSFFNGALAIFFPHCLFVYWIFFRKSAKNQNKMTGFYTGEGLKWLATMILIGVSFKFVSNLHFIAFFLGYFVALCLNVALPAVIASRTK